MSEPSTTPKLALDAHYYSGGLRVRRLHGDPAPWVPSPPERFAGYRDEVPLDGRDEVVEIARLSVDGVKLWWIALYRASSDDQLGDRGNHAGVGVWIGDAQIAEAALLLDGLRQLTAKLNDRGLDEATQLGHSFATGFLPQYVTSGASLPPQLDGWHRASAPMPVTRVYVCDAQPGGGELDRIAEQVHRMALMPAPTDDPSRAVILVRAAGSTAGATLEPLPDGLLKEVVGRLPKTMAAIEADYGSLRATAERASADAAGLRTELASVHASREQARARVTELEQQLADNDPGRRLAAIDDHLRRIVATTGRTENDLRDLRRASQHRSERAYLSSTDRGTEPDRSPSYGARHPQESQESFRDTLQPLLWPIAAMVLFAIVLIETYTIFRPT